jgi:hypothetical protein
MGSRIENFETESKIRSVAQFGTFLGAAEFCELVDLRRKWVNLMI